MTLRVDGSIIGPHSLAPLRCPKERERKKNALMFPFLTVIYYQLPSQFFSDQKMSHGFIQINYKP